MQTSTQLLHMGPTVIRSGCATLMLALLASCCQDVTLKEKLTNPAATVPLEAKTHKT